MNTYAGLVEYDGSDFAGWATQPGYRTVEATLTDALQTVLRQPVKLSVAGRTDAGVHASGQTVSFSARTEIPASTIAYKTTAVLAHDLALRRCTLVPDGFDARKDARFRDYEYRVVNDPIRSPLRHGRTLFIPRPLDFDLLQETAALVRGRRDFRAFTPSRAYHVRFERIVTESRWERRGDLLVYYISADSFLYGMVRSLVGTMLEVALGKRDLASFARLVSGGERADAGPSASPRGLTLTRVRYDDPGPWT
jgi:tRNA pseudouridine38-40 synthase